jgi:hypothetical protein
MRHPQGSDIFIEDVNFDKVNDIRMIEFIPATPNTPYYYWTFNSLTKCFERNTSLEQITSPDFDHDKKLITSFWPASCCDHGTSTYKYIDKKPVLTEESEVAQDINDNSKYIITVKKRTNGKMKLIEKTVEIHKSDSDK